MKINKCIMSCDENPLYLDFWPIVSEIWKRRFNIDPVLIFIGNENSLDNTFGSIIFQPQIKNIPVYIQSLWARYYYTSIFSEDVCIISDIDMFPISKWFFKDQLIPFIDDAYIHLDVPDNRRMLASCYHISKGKNFKKYLSLNNTFEESILDLKLWWEQQNPLECSFWYSDELYATHLLKNKPFIHIKRKELNRIDRDMDWDNKNVLDYIDCHSYRPYKTYKLQIDKLTKCLLN